MAYPTIIDLILIGAISGLIAICIYSLRLEDKLLSRVERLEGELSSARAKTDASAMKIPAANFPISKEANLSRGSGVDREKPVETTFGNDFPPTFQKPPTSENGNFERIETPPSLPENTSHAAKKPEPVEDDAFEWPQDQF